MNDDVIKNMRLGVIVPLLALGIALAVSLRYLHSQNRLPAGKIAGSSEKPEAAAVPPGMDVENVALAPTTETTITNDSSSEIRGTVAEHETYVEKRVAELQDLAMDNDPKSLQVILSELTNRDPEIRQAAVDAAVQFGSRDAIPKLADAALQTEDAAERAAMLEAAEYLKLPSFRETLDNTPRPRSAAAKVRTWKLTPAANPPR